MRVALKLNHSHATAVNRVLDQCCHDEPPLKPQEAPYTRRHHITTLAVVHWYHQHQASQAAAVVGPLLVPA